jgi:hypothetical protein
MRAIFQNDVLAYSARECCELFKPACGRVVIARAIRAGELHGHMVGARRYFLARDVAAWIEQQKDYSNGSPQN